MNDRINRFIKRRKLEDAVPDRPSEPGDEEQSEIPDTSQPSAASSSSELFMSFKDKYYLLGEEDNASSSTGCSYYQPPTSPFQLPHIFKDILRYLPVKDWKTCRLVSQAWHAACSNGGRPKKFRLVIPDHQRLTLLINREIAWDQNQIPAIFEDLKLPERVPLTGAAMLCFFKMFGQYIKRLYIPDGWSIEALQIILFQRCHNLEELHLTGNIPYGTPRLSLLQPELGIQPGTLPNLKKLVLDIINAHARLPPEVMNIFPPGFLNITDANPNAKLLITDLLGLAPNLEWVRCPTRRDIRRDKSLCLRLATVHGCTVMDIETSFNRINQFLAQKLFSGSHHCNPKLTRLDLYLRLNARGMDKLAAKLYPLKSIDLHVRTIDKRGLKDLLPKLGNTLKHLRVTVDNKFDFDFPCECLHELETLHLEDYAGDLLFIGDIPKLKSLTIGFFHSQVFLKKFTPTFVNHSLKSLILEKFILFDQQPQVIKKLSVVFPQLSKLDVENVNDVCLQKIYDCLPQLHELRISSCEVSNAGICGFTEFDTTAILDAGYELGRYQEYENLRRLPYIGDLKNLKSLTLMGQLSLLTSRFAFGRMMTTLRSLWILHGVCSLVNLRVLTVHGVTVSSLELKQLLRKLSLCRLELINCKIDPAALNWMQKQQQTTAMEFVLRKTEENYR